MARKARVEIAGGLYHVITRGNNRRQMFSSPADYEKFLGLLANQKQRLPFFLYAYCLMTNHVHLLIERQADTIGRIMHRVLTGYSQYYNRRYGRVGHLLQGRHKAILCQTDQYLSELVRYIHLNPVRAKMVRKPEEYRYSSHRAYLGLETTNLVDVDSVLRHYGAKKESARERFSQFVQAGIKLGHREEFYLAAEGMILGTEEFVDGTIHRIGETRKAKKKQYNQSREFNAEALIKAVEDAFRIPRADFCGSRKSALAITAKEALILIGLEVGAKMSALSEITGMNSSSVSRRHDAAKRKLRVSTDMRKLMSMIESQYRKSV
jgi:putative transposase